METIQVLVADSSFLVQAGVEYIVDTQEDLQFIGAASSRTSLFNYLKTNPSAILILDYHASKAFSKKMVYEIMEKIPNQKLIIITGDTNRHNIYELIENGISCMLTKECGKREILDAIYAIGRNEKFFCSKILNLILEKSFQKDVETCEALPLTPREIEIVKLVAEGKVAKEIAHELNISTHTIYTHRKTILKKLQVNTTAELVLFAIKNKLIPQPI